MRIKTLLAEGHRIMDFALRNSLRYPLPVGTAQLDQLQLVRWQQELTLFLSGFEWGRIHRRENAPASYSCLDVGAKNFASGPVIESVLQDAGIQTEVVGIEIDAYRRSFNLRSRADYGRYFAAQMKAGRFVAEDFLRWNEPADLLFVLHPFVTQAHHLNWGLPKSHFRPKEFFEHCRKLLAPRAGWVCLSSPSEAESQIARQYLSDLGFQAIGSHDWHPRPHSLQKQPRLGTLWRLRAL